MLQPGSFSPVPCVERALGWGDMTGRMVGWQGIGAGFCGQRRRKLSFIRSVYHVNTWVFFALLLID